MERILLIDDDVQLCRLLAERLATEQYEVEAIHDGSSGLERALSMQHALVVLDLMLPGMGGLDVLRRLRAVSPVPVLILTARGEDSNRILGLEMGADDYVPKPFNPRELIARIRAILRRTGRTGASAGPLAVGDLRIDPSVREAWLEDLPLNLTSAEFTLLETFMRDPGRVLSREQLGPVRYLQSAATRLGTSFEISIRCLRESKNSSRGSGNWFPMFRTNCDRRSRD